MEDKKKETKKKDEKYNKVIEILQDMETGEIIKPTALFKPAGINPNDTGRDLLDLYSSLAKIGFTIRRDKKKGDKVTEIEKTEDPMETKEEIRNLRKEIIDIKNSLDRREKTSKEILSEIKIIQEKLFQ